MKKALLSLVNRLLPPSEQEMKDVVGGLPIPENHPTNKAVLSSTASEAEKKLAPPETPTPAPRMPRVNSKKDIDAAICAIPWAVGGAPSVMEVGTLEEILKSIVRTRTSNVTFRPDGSAEVIRGTARFSGIEQVKGNRQSFEVRGQVSWNHGLIEFCFEFSATISFTRKDRQMEQTGPAKFGERVYVK